MAQLNTAFDYKSDEYVNKVFKYFALELIRDNDNTNLLEEEEMFNLATDDFKMGNVNELPKCIQNLHEDIMKKQNNYLFSYYLSRLYENRIADDNDHSAKKYFDFSEYIIGLDLDFETFDWSDYDKVKKNEDLYNIYGEKMHMITNEFLNDGFVGEVLKNENIDNVIQVYIEELKEKSYVSKIEKLSELEENLDKWDIVSKQSDNEDKEDNEQSDSEDDEQSDSEDSDDEDDVDSDSEDSDSEDDVDDDSEDSDSEDDVDDDSEDDVDYKEDLIEYDEVNEWYYGTDDTRKRKFEEIIFDIIEKYDNNKRRKIDNAQNYEGSINTLEVIKNEFKKFCMVYVVTYFICSCLIKLFVNKEELFNYVNLNNLTNILSKMLLNDDTNKEL